MHLSENRRFWWVQAENQLLNPSMKPNKASEPCGFPLEVTFTPQTRSTIVQLTGGGDDGGGADQLEEPESPVEDVKPPGGCGPAVFHSFLGPGVFCFRQKGADGRKMAQNFKFYTSLMGVEKQEAPIHLDENANDVNKPLCSHPLLFKSSATSRRQRFTLLQYP